MKTTLVIVCFLLLSLVSAGQTKKPGAEYVGYNYKGVTPGTTLPNGVKHLGGSLVGEINSDPVHGISQVSKGKMKMLWLEVSTGQDSGGVTGWLVKDVLSFYNQRANDHLLFGADPAIECNRDGKPVEHLVGIGKIDRKQDIFRPSILWTANLKTLKFDPVSTTGFKCQYSEP